jgi:hypothetical protein
MKLVHEIDPHDFSFWSGAADRMNQATEEQRHEIFDRIEELAELAAESGQPLTDTDINDYVWFECDDVFDEEVEE